MTTIILEKLSTNVSKRSIHNLYSQYISKILDIRLKDNKAVAPHFWKYAFVEVLPEEVKIALSVPVSDLGEFAAASLCQNLNRQSGDRIIQILQNKVDARITFDVDSVVAAMSVFVEELSVNISVEDLRNYFGRFGEIDRVKLSDDFRNEYKKLALVIFKDVKSAADACQRLDAVIGGTYVIILPMEKTCLEKSLMWSDTAAGRLGHLLKNETVDEAMELIDMLLDESPSKNSCNGRQFQRTEREQMPEVYHAAASDYDSYSSDEEEYSLDRFPEALRIAARQIEEEKMAYSSRHSCYSITTPVSVDDIVDDTNLVDHPDSAAAAQPPPVGSVQKDSSAEAACVTACKISPVVPGRGRGIGNLPRASGRVMTGLGDCADMNDPDHVSQNSLSTRGRGLGVFNRQRLSSMSSLASCSSSGSGKSSEPACGVEPRRLVTIGRGLGLRSRTE